MQINLRNKILTVVGLNNSGKSYFIKNGILPNYNAFVIDILHEYPTNIADVYYPKQKVYPFITKEIETVIKEIIEKQKYELIVFEEASRIFPNQKELMPIMREFLDVYRHYNQCGLVFICRRPAQLHTDIPSLSHHIVSFGTKGLADINRLNSESAGLGDVSAKLSNYRYVLVNQDRTFIEMHPI